MPSSMSPCPQCFNSFWVKGGSYGISDQKCPPNSSEWAFSTTEHKGRDLLLPRMYFTGGTSLLPEARPYYRVLAEGESHPKTPLLPLPQERGKEKLSRLPVLATASSPSCICLSLSLLMGSVINRSFSLSPACTLGQAFSSSWCLRESRSAAWLTAALRLPFHLKLLHGHFSSSPYNHQTAHTYIMILGHRLDIIRLPDHRWSPSSSLLPQLWQLTRSLPHPSTFFFFHSPPHTPNGMLLWDAGSQTMPLLLQVSSCVLFKLQDCFSSLSPKVFFSPHQLLKFMFY